MAQDVRKAVIPVAGLGTRFLPVTKAVPKELLPIGTKPTLQFVIEEAADSGITDVVLVSSPQKMLIQQFFDRDTPYDKSLAKAKKEHMLDEQRRLTDRVSVHSVMQDEPKGLGHAILCSNKAVGDEPFIVILPDVLIESNLPCCKQLINAYEETGCSVNATEHTPREQLHLYGIYDIGKSDGRYHWAKAVVEKPSADEAPSDFSVVGRYLFTPDVYTILEDTPPGKGGEIQLADAMNTLAKQNRMVAYEYEGHQYDTGDNLGFIKANIFYGLKQYPDELRSFMRNLTK